MNHLWSYFVSARLSCLVYIIIIKWFACSCSKPCHVQPHQFTIGILIFMSIHRFQSDHWTLNEIDNSVILCRLTWWRQNNNIHNDSVNTEMSSLQSVNNLEWYMSPSIWQNFKHLPFTWSFDVFFSLNMISNKQRWVAGPRLNIKTIFPRYGGPHVKDKTVVRPSYL